LNQSITLFMHIFFKCRLLFSAPLSFFGTLLTCFDSEGISIVIHSIVSNLRFPNMHAIVLSALLLSSLFTQTKQRKRLLFVCCSSFSLPAPCRPGASFAHSFCSRHNHNTTSFSPDSSTKVRLV
jgi:hypothetical protein